MRKEVPEVRREVPEVQKEVPETQAALFARDWEDTMHRARRTQEGTMSNNIFRTIEFLL